MWTIFKVFIEFCYNAASVLCFSFCASRHVGILASRPGIDPTPSALEAEALTMDHQGGPSIASNNILFLVPWTWRPWFHVYTPIPLVNPAMCCPPELNPAVVIFRFQLWSQQRTKHSIGMSVIYKIRRLPATFYSFSFTACFSMSVICQNGLFNVREGQPPCFFLISKRKTEKHFTKSIHLQTTNI